MTALLALSSLLTAGNISIRLERQGFAVSEGRTVEHVPFEPNKATPKSTAVYRRDAAFVVWDERGLTVRNGGKPFTTRFKEAPLSPRLRSRDDIRETLDAKNRYGRKMEASALSGSRRIGKDVFFLVRWQGGPGQIWLEALTHVDLSQRNPRPDVLAVVDGITFSSAPVEDNLFLSDRTLFAYVHRGTTWGKWTYDIDSHRSETQSLGDGAKFVKATPDGRVAFVEKSSYGPYLAGLVDAATGKKEVLAEGPALWKFIDLGSPLVVEGANDNNEKILATLATGSRFVLPPDAKVGRTKMGILVWDHGNRPERAWLLDPTDWHPLSWWKSKRPAGAGPRSSER